MRETFDVEIKLCVHEIESLKDDSKKKTGTPILEHENFLVLLKSQIIEVEQEVEAAKNEYTNSTIFVNELQKKLSELIEKYEETCEDYRNIEAITSTKIAKLEEEKSKKQSEINVLDREAWTIGVSYDALSRLYTEQSQALSDKIELIEKYENRNKSFSEEVCETMRLGLTAALEKSKNKSKLASRGISLVKDSSQRSRPQRLLVPYND